MDRLPFDSFTLVSVSNPESGFELEQTHNAGRVEPNALGDGYGHLALSVPDVAAEHARLTAAGLGPASWWILPPAAR